MDQKKYVDIERLKDKYAMAFKAGEHITVSEKIDGANASIRYDAETGSLVAFSRRQRLTEDNNLQGFYAYVLTLDPVKWADVTSNGRFIVFGEWLVKHTIKYPDDLMRKFYVFDVWDTEVEQYVPWFLTYQIAQALGLKTVPIFYDGEFTSWEDLYALVGRTEMQAEPTGEGIVIKSQDRLDNKFSGTPAYVKIVAKEFSEVHQSKPQKEIDPTKIAAKQAAQYVTVHAHEYGFSGMDEAEVYVAALIHDIGKPICKTYKLWSGKIDDHAHYYGHADVGAYMVACLLRTIPEEDYGRWLTILELIQYHMDCYADPDHWLEKIEKSKGLKFRNMLELLHEGDKNGH